MDDIFISYRTVDAAHGAAACYELLAARFGSDRVFRDCVSMLPGQEYPDEINAALERTRVLVAIIGPRWLTAADADGNRLVDHPGDWVRREIARALDRRIPVIPLLLDEAPLPWPADLPESISALTRRQTARVRHQWLGPDVGRLADQITRLLPDMDRPASGRPVAGTPPGRGVGGTAALAVGGGVLAAAAAVAAGTGGLEGVDPLILAFSCLGLGVAAVMWSRRRRRVEPPSAQVTVPAWDSPVVPRPELHAEVVRLLVAGDRTAPVALTTALRGAGGFGKSVLAAEVCRDPAITAHFPGGVLWVTLGERPAPAELTEMVNGLCRSLRNRDEESPPLENLHQAGQELGRLLSRRPPTLLVVDDVWSAADLRPFLYGGAGCRRLVTTRMAGALPDGARQIRVDELTAGQARALLTQGLSGLGDAVVDGLIDLTGRWALLLALVNRALTEAVEDGAEPDTAAGQVGAALRRDGPAALDLGDELQRERLVAATIEVSLSFLDDTDKERFLQLGVFPEDVWIPEALLAVLWGLGRTQRLCRQLTRMSLVAGRRAGEEAAVRLHDVVRDYLRARRDSADGHIDLLDGVRVLLDTPADGGRTRTPWWDLPLDADYLWRWLPYHLKGAGRDGEAAALVTDPRWIATKTKVSGPLPVEADLAGVEVEPAEALRRALAQSAHLLGPTEPTDAVVAILLSRLRADPALRRHFDGFPLGGPALVDHWPLPDTPDPALVRVLTGHDDSLSACAWSPHDTLLVTGGRDRTARVWDVALGVEKRVLVGHSGAVNACAWSPDGGFVATACDDGVVRVWMMADDDGPVELAGHSGAVTGCDWSPDGRFLASCGQDGAVRAWDVAAGAGWSVIGAIAAPVNGCAWSPGGESVATACDDSIVRVWSATGSPLLELAGHDGWVNGCAWSPDGRSLASFGQDGFVRIWDVAEGVPRRELGPHAGWVSGCAWSPRGDLIAVACDDGDVRVWEVSTGRQRSTVTGHAGWVGMCAWSSAAGLLASVGRDASVRVWDVDRADQSGGPSSHAGWVAMCAWSSDGALVASVGEDQTIRLWDADSGADRGVLRGHAGPIRGCAWSPEGRLLASAGDDGAIVVWDVDQASALREFTGHTGWVYACAWSPDGTRIASAGDQTVRVWDVASGNQESVLVGHTEWVNGCVWSPDGTRVASAGDRTVRVWDVAGGTEELVLTGHTESVTSCAWSPDGRVVASASLDKTVRVWDAEDGSPLAELKGHTNSVHGCAWSPDGTWLASAGDRTVRVWEWQSGRCVTLMRTEEALLSCAWSPAGGGRCLLALAGDGGVYVFGYDPPA